MHLRHYGALALLALPALSQAQTATEPAALIDGRIIVKEGIALHDAEKYDEAAARYRLVTPGDSAYDTAQAELALSLSSAKKYQESIAAAQRSMAVNAFEPELYNTLGSDYEALKQPAEAQKAYQAGLKLFPYSELLWVNQGIFALGQHDIPGALASLQRSVELRPAKASGHRLLGTTAIQQGQTTHAMLSWLVFLAIEPNGPRSHDVLVSLEQLAQGSFTVDKEDQAAPVAPNAAFEELDQLITSKVALNPNYTTKVKFKAAIVKQIQLLVEKFPVDADPASDFWTRTYAPVIKALRLGDNLTTFTYLVLSSADDKSAQQWIKSNKGKLEKLAEAVTEPLLSLRNQQPLPGGGRAVAWFNGVRLEGLGAGQRDAKGQVIPSGDWLLVAKDGSVRQQGKYTAEGKRTGVWRTLRPDGTLLSELTYGPSGEQEGPGRYYYPSGQLKSEGTYRAGKLEGLSKNYGEGGELHQTRNFVGNDFEGEAVDYYADGTPLFRAKMHADKKDGPLEDYWADGTLRRRVAYAQDKRQGELVQYYPDKTLEIKANYDQGDLHGAYATFHTNGKPHEAGQYTHGKRTGAWKEFYSNGQPNAEKTYDDQGELHGPYLDYDRQGRHYSTTQYEHGRLAHLIYFDAAGKPTVDTPLKKSRTPVKTYDVEGHLKSTGDVENGHLIGEWKSYWPDGTLREISNYDAKGDLTGIGELYYTNGQLRQRRHYAPGGEATGYFEQYYADGELSRTGYQRQGQEQGVWKNYYPNGQLSQETEYFHGDFSGPMRSYALGGKLTQTWRYEFGKLRQLATYDSTGTAIDRLDLGPATKEVVIHFPGKSGKVLNRAGFRSGEYTGPTTWLWPNGRPESESKLYDGRRYGRYVNYYPSGQLHTESQYLHGQRYGTYTTYHPGGQVRLRAHYLAGEAVGEWTYYFATGQTEWTVPYDNEGELDGPSRFYNPAGELLLTKNYAHGVLVSISGPAPTAASSPPTMPATGPITTQFANGKPAAQERYEHLYPAGTATYYYASGQVFRRSAYHKGLLSGPTTSYWPSGKLMEEENYLHNELHGRCRYYRPDGTLEREENYRVGERTGPSIMYDAQGKPQSQLYYWNSTVYNPQ